MSKINRIRIVNLNYNNNTCRIDDETFDLAGQNTLLTLRNGGGKTVLVQMISSLFVHDRYKDMDNRPFKSYFTTHKPTFLMVEWLLDDDAGYFLTGMMVRKNQNPEEDHPQDLETVTFTGSYTSACAYDLDHMPIVDTTSGRRLLNGFGKCKREFQKIKADGNLSFDFYDMSVRNQSVRYFHTLREYQIDSREWETIIKKVNAKESGLSELFRNANDEYGLMEHWFLDAVNKKLNGEKDRIKEFEKLMYHLMEQYRSNQANIEKKERIEQYFVDIQPVQSQIEVYQQAQNRLRQQKGKLVVFRELIEQRKEALEHTLMQTETKIAQLEKEVLSVRQEQFSYEIQMDEKKREEKAQERVQEEVALTGIHREREKNRERLLQIACAKRYREMQDFYKSMLQKQEALKIAGEESDKQQEEITRLGAILYAVYCDERLQIESKIKETKNRLRDIHAACTENAKKQEAETKTKEELWKDIAKLEALLEQFAAEEQIFTKEYGETLERNVLGEYEEGLLELYAKKFQVERETAVQQQIRLQEKQKKWEQEKEDFQSKREDNREAIRANQQEIEHLSKEQKMLCDEKKQRETILSYIGLSAQFLDKKDVILENLSRKLALLEKEKAQLYVAAKELEHEIQNNRDGKVLEVPQELLQFFEEENISFLYGMEWLRKNQKSVKENEQLVKAHPFLPYVIILEEDSYQRLQQAKRRVYTSVPIPIVRRKQLLDVAQKDGNVCDFGSVSFYVMFEQELLDEEKVKDILQKKQLQLDRIQQTIANKEGDMDVYRTHKETVKQQRYSHALLLEVQKQQQEGIQRQQDLQEEQQSLLEKIQSHKSDGEQLQTELMHTAERIRLAEHKSNAFVSLTQKYENYLQHKSTYERKCRQQKENQEAIRKLGLQAQQLMSEKECENDHVHELEREKKELDVQIDDLIKYKEENDAKIPVLVEMIPDVDEIAARFYALQREITSNIQNIQEDYERESRRYHEKKNELERMNIKGYTDTMLAQLVFSEQEEVHLTDREELLETQENQVVKQVTNLEKEISRLEERIENARKRMKEELGEVVLLGLEMIKNTDFAGRKKVAEYEIRRQRRQQTDTIREREQCVGICTSLDAYKDFNRDETIDVTPLSQMAQAQDWKQVREASMRLRQEFYQYQTDCEKQLRETERMIRELAANKAYADDYFAKGFTHLLTLIEDVAMLQTQLETQLAVYQTQLERLAVDLANIKKERLVVEDTFLDYIKNVDDDIKKIDDNSTIQVRGRGLKMLRIQTPDWELHKEHYRLRLHDLLEQMIAKGLHTIVENGNVEEMIGSYISTKQLYDAVIGICNVEIKLLKLPTPIRCVEP